MHSFSKWVGEDWAEVSKNKIIRRAFEKCGNPVPTDGSKDEAIKNKGLDESYQVWLADSEVDDDPFELDIDSELE